MQLDEFRDKYFLRDYHHNLCNKYILHQQKFSAILVFTYFVIRTFSKRPTLFFFMEYNLYAIQYTCFTCTVWVLTNTYRHVNTFAIKT